MPGMYNVERMRRQVVAAVPFGSKDFFRGSVAVNVSDHIASSRIRGM